MFDQSDFFCICYLVEEPNRMNSSDQIMGPEDGLICSNSSTAAVASKSWHQPGCVDCNMWNNCIALNL